MALDPTCKLRDCDTIYSVQYYRADGSGRVIVTKRNQPVDRWKVIDSAHIEITHDTPVDQPEGAVVVAFHTRSNFGMIFGETSDAVLERVVLRTAPGMGFVGTAVENLTIRNCTVAPNPSSGRIISTAADAVHFWGCRGHFEISDSVFAGMGDDGVNIHSFLLGASFLPKNSIELQEQNLINNRSVRLHPILYPRAGDELAAFDRQSFAPLGGFRVISAAERKLQIDTNGTLPSDMLVTNLTQMPTVEIKRSKFSNGAACGALLRGNMTVEECEFTDLGWMGLNGQVDQNWLEGPPIGEAFVRRNVFTRCGHNFRGSVACSALVKSTTGGLTTAPTPVQGNLQVEGCEFIDAIGLPLSVVATKNVRIAQNNFQILREDDNGVLSSDTAVQVSGCGNVAVEKNTSNCTRSLNVEGKAVKLNSNHNLFVKNSSERVTAQSDASCKLVRSAR